MTTYKRILDRIYMCYKMGDVFSPSDLSKKFSDITLSADYSNVFSTLVSNKILQELNPGTIIRFAPWHVQYKLIKMPEQKEETLQELGMRLVNMINQLPSKNEKIDLSKVPTKDLMEEISRRVK